MGRDEPGTKLGALRVGAEWLSETLSPTRWVFRLLENWSLVLGLAVPAAVLAWLLTGVVLIHENERAVVTRFGRAEADLAPGLYWRFPVPFERVYRDHVGRLRTVQIGFRAAEDRPLAQTDALLPVEWTSEHNEAGFETRPEESLVLTGDEVLVEMTAEVQWRISNLAAVSVRFRPARRDAANACRERGAAKRRPASLWTAS